MCACSKQCEFTITDEVNKQPVWCDMAFTTATEISHEPMVAVMRR